MSRLTTFGIFAILTAAAILGGCSDSDTKPKSSDDGEAKTTKTATKTETSGTSETNETSETTKTNEEPDEVVATIVPGEGIRGINIDDSLSAITQELGEPDSKRDASGEFGEFDELTWGESLVVRVSRPDNSVVFIETTSPDDSTTEGIRVGSSLEDVQSSFASAQCDDTDPGICRVGPGDAGSIVTDFFVADGTVTRIAIGLVID